jgi:peptide-methionine (S)-S-oxide reductase
MTRGPSADAPPASSPPPLAVATLGGGCFWCLDAVYRELRGVHAVASGYAGGTMPNPGYELGCTGITVHAAGVQLHFDPSEISYRTLLDVFFVIHDPTTRNRQGHDIGTQYRSVIFTHDEEQAATASAVIAELDAQQLWPRPIVTEVLLAPTFWPAEKEHQDYFTNHPVQPYCLGVVAPKVAKARATFREQLARR